MTDEDYTGLTVRGGGEVRGAPSSDLKIYKKNFCEAKTGCDRFLTLATRKLNYSGQAQTNATKK
jgi:hypothetical protein